MVTVDDEILKNGGRDPGGGRKREPWTGGTKTQEAKIEEPRTVDCGCWKVLKLDEKDVWKGHLCTADLSQLRSAIIRTALRKGHKFKVDEGVESVVPEVRKGLEGYIAYWAGKRRAEQEVLDQLEKWKDKVLAEVTRKLTSTAMDILPRGNSLRKEIMKLSSTVVFLKEDRAPHVGIVMCKKRYLHELGKEMTNTETFEEVQETEEDILARHAKFHLDRGLPANDRLPYPYGIWKSAKRKIRWISGVKKSAQDKQRKLTSKPQGSIAGAGTELVSLLNEVMDALREKDAEAQERGEPKKCWFVQSVEEVVHPIRFRAEDLAKYKGTVDTVDFVTMYPKFDQHLLLKRVREAIEEAWGYQEHKRGTPLCLSKRGWEPEMPEAQPEGWTRMEVMELVEFVVKNGYWKAAGKIKHQVRGFGMGLQCAPQLANLACYIPERDFAATCTPEEVEHNYRFIDDILTLSGKIPSEEAYGMQYRSTRKSLGVAEYLGMKIVWNPETRGKVRVTTELLQREAAYPIRILRYPAKDTTCSEAQRLGVITGQFIRAQRICSHLKQFKEGVVYITTCALRRGYSRRRLHQVWGRFLGKWWSARELRRGELRSWYKRATRYALRVVKREEKEKTRRGGQGGEAQNGAPEKEREGGGRNAEGKQARSPRQQEQPQKESPVTAEEVELLQGIRGSQRQQRHPEKWLVKSQWDVVRRPPDGHCLYHCLVEGAGLAEAKVMRVKIATWLKANLEVLQGGTTMQSWILLQAEEHMKEADPSVSEAVKKKIVEKYLTGVRTSVYGGHLEIHAFTRLSGISVAVYRAMRIGYSLMKWEPAVQSDLSDAEPRVIRVLASGRGEHLHYDELRKAQQRKSLEGEDTEEIDCRSEEDEEYEPLAPSRTSPEEGAAYPTKSTQSRSKKQRNKGQKRQREQADPEQEKEGEGEEEMTKKRGKGGFRIKAGSSQSRFVQGKAPRKERKRRRRKKTKRSQRSKWVELKTLIAWEVRERSLLEMSARFGAEFMSRREQSERDRRTRRKIEELSPETLLEQEEAARLTILDQRREEMARTKEREQKALRKAKMRKRWRETLEDKETDGRSKLKDDERKEYLDIVKKKALEHKKIRDQEDTEKSRGQLLELEKALARSYYEALGVPRDAHIKVIKRAGRALAMKCHPDKFPENKELATKVFRALQAALELLADDVQRHDYDLQLEVSGPPPRRSPAAAWWW